MSRELLINAFVVGAALLAVWLWARLGDRGPRSIKLVVVHFALAFVTLALVPLALSGMIGDDPSPRLAIVGLFTVFLPAMTYVLLSALWVFDQLNRSLRTR